MISNSHTYILTPLSHRYISKVLVEYLHIVLNELQRHQLILVFINGYDKI